MSNNYAVRNILWLAITVFSLALFGGLFTPAHAGHITCGAILGPGGVHVLDSNVGPCDFAIGFSAAITVLSSNGRRATLDMNGFDVSCADTNTDGLLPDGIVVLGNKALVKNTPITLGGTVTGCKVGLVIQGNSNTVEAAISSNGNVEDGFDITGDKNKLTLAFSENNGGNGFSIDGARNTVDLARGSNNGINGFFIFAGEGNLLSRTIGNSNTQDGYLILTNRNGLKTNTAENNGENGFAITGDRNNLIQNDSTGNIAGDGFLIQGSRNTLRENHAVNNRDGFDIAGDSNMVQNNLAENNGDEGFDISGNRNIVKGNNALANSDNGFATGPGTRNKLTGNNVAENNGDRGFLIFSDFNTLTGNSANNNGIGIEVNDGFVGNHIINNNATGNSTLDLSDKNGECTSNTWRNNTFVTSNPACIR